MDFALFFIYYCIQSSIITRINQYLTPGVAFGFTWKHAQYGFDVFWAFEQTDLRWNVTVLHNAATLKVMIEV